MPFLIRKLTTDLGSFASRKRYKLGGFQDWKRVRVISGSGGDGSIAFEKCAKVAFGYR